MHMQQSFNSTNHCKLLTIQKQYLSIKGLCVNILISLEKETIISIRDLLIRFDDSITESQHYNSKLIPKEKILGA